MQIAICCENLKKTYPGKPPVEAVRGISFSVNAGECYGVLGPNGAGKTTTIEILEGLLDATSGSAEVLGMNWGTSANAIRQRIGVSLQETQLSERLTVRETLKLFRSFYSDGISAEQAVERVSLTAKRDVWVKNLSGGQKQRLAVATALVGNPDLIFLDEPTTGLDPSSRRELWEIIESFTDSGKTVMLTTHYMEEAERLCDRVAIFDNGEIITEGTPSALIQSLGAEHVIEFATDRRLEGGDLELLRQIETVDQVEMFEDQYRISLGHPHQVLPQLIDHLSDKHIAMTNLATRSATLEDVFVAKTGKQLSSD